MAIFDKIGKNIGGSATSLIPKTMPLHVICSGCLKRFQVSERFAGMQGPCPHCGTGISIPKKSVKIHDVDESEVKQPRSKKRLQYHPFPRLRDADFEPAQSARYAWAVVGVVLFAFVLGCIPMPSVLRSLLGIMILGLAAFPLTLFGYRIMLDRELIFAITGTDLYRRAGIVAAGYVILWCLFEYFLAAFHGDIFVNWSFFSIFAVLATLLVHPLLELKLPDAFLHFSIFGMAIILLRFCIGLGWFWKSGDWIRYSTAPPPPLLPGM